MKGNTDKAWSARPTTRTIAVCGSIAVGKTSFVPYLSAALPGGCHYLEDVWENPYLADFYRDMKTWSFHSRIAFLAIKARIYENVERNCSWLVIDRPVHELITFARLHRDIGVLSPLDFETFLSLYGTLTRFLPTPDFIVHLRCSPEESLRRIRARGREFEQNIDLLYLRQIDHYYDEWLREIAPDRVIKVDTDDLSKMQDVASTIAKRACHQPYDGNVR